MWNNKEISHFFPSFQAERPHKPPKVVDYSWQSSSGVTFNIEAHAFPTEVGHQYEMLIDGRSFFDLPRPKDLLACNREPHRVSPEKYPVGPPVREISRGESMMSEESENARAVVQEAQQQRLSSSGFGMSDELEDALRSDLYSSSLDALRGEMINSVPELEEMMSRAIIYAFSEDHDSCGSSFANDTWSLHTEDELDPAEVEADALCEAYEWMKWTVLHEPAHELRDLKLEYMRSHVETMVAHARHERLSPHAASRIMISISAVLDLKLARRIQRDTLIISGMTPGVTTRNVYQALNPYGPIQSVCTARGESGFGESNFACPPGV